MRERVVEGGSGRVNTTKKKAIKREVKKAESRKEISQYDIAIVTEQGSN